MDDRNLIGERKQKVHVVLDHHDREVPFELADELEQAVPSVGAHALRRLVEEQDARLGRQGHRDLERAPLAVGKTRGTNVGARAEPHLLDDCKRSRNGGRIARDIAHDVETRRTNLGQREKHILERGEFVEEADDLE